MFKRRPKISPGQLRLWYGRLDGDSPDICGGWGGAGADKCDSHLMMSHFTSKRLALVYGEEREKLGRNYKFERSFVEELEARGFDISTIQFSIKMKASADSTTGDQT